MGRDLLFKFIVIIVELTVFMAMLTAGAVILELILPKLRQFSTIISWLRCEIKSE